MELEGRRPRRPKRDTDLHEFTRIYIIESLE